MSKQEEMRQAPAELLSNVTWRRNQIVTESATLCSTQSNISAFLERYSTSLSINKWNQLILRY